MSYLDTHWNTNSEGKKMIHKVLKLYGFFIAIYILGSLVLRKQLSYYWLLSFVGFVCSAQVIHLLKFSPDQPNRTERQKRAKYFKALDWTLVTGFIMIGTLRIELIHVSLTNFVIPGYLNTILYYLYCDDSNSFFKTRTLTIYKLLFWTQVLLVALKVDGVIDNWAFVFVALFYTFVFFMSVSVGFFILAFSYFCQGCHLNGFDYNLVGLVWDFLNALFSWVWGFSLLGIIEQLRDDNGTSLLFPALTVGVIHCTVLVLYTVLLRKNLGLYLTSTLHNMTGNDEEVTQTVSHSFETVKQSIPYLLKVSPTYFMVMGGDSKMKDQSRTAIKQAQEVKKQRILKFQNSKRIIIQAPKRQNNFEHKSATLRVGSFKGKLSDNSPMTGTSCENTPSHLHIRKAHLYYSDDDIDIVSQVLQRKAQNQDNEENNPKCVVCCMEEPNAVFMRCGHGGICYECALETWKKGDKCIMCRQPIDEILKVTLVNEINVAKVIEGTKKYPTIAEIQDE